mmetsp:Transcript_4311/g.15488  ORF Transcript_4311/g.15488 Transcript_4311/m.15488 type:complete len:709 (-) Transcript_4311:23-2149(-)
MFKALREMATDVLDPADELHTYKMDSPAGKTGSAISDSYSGANGAPKQSVEGTPEGLADLKARLAAGRQRAQLQQHKLQALQSYVSDGTRSSFPPFDGHDLAAPTPEPASADSQGNDSPLEDVNTLKKRLVQLEAKNDSLGALVKQRDEEVRELESSLREEVQHRRNEEQGRRREVALLEEQVRSNDNKLRHYSNLERERDLATRRLYEALLARDNKITTQEAHERKDDLIALCAVVDSALRDAQSTLSPRPGPNSHTAQECSAEMKTLQAKLDEKEHECLRLAGEVATLSDSSRTLEGSHVDGLTAEMEGLRAALEQEKVQGAAIRSELEAALLQRDKAQKEASKLKAYFVAQDENEMKVIEQENAEFEALKRSYAEREKECMDLTTTVQASEARIASLQQQVEQASHLSHAEVEQLRQVISQQKNALESRATEVSNLQSALGQFYAEQEFDQDLRNDVRRLEREKLELQTHKEQVLKELREEKQHRSVAEESLAKAKALAKSLKLERDGTLHEMMKTRRALQESMIRVTRLSTDENEHVDRRIVVKLLLTYFERKQSVEVMQLIMSILGFTEHERETMEKYMAQHRKGLLRGAARVVAAPLKVPLYVAQPLVKALATPGPDLESNPDESTGSIADKWVSFLISHTDEQASLEGGQEELELSPVSDLSYTSTGGVSSSRTLPGLSPGSGLQVEADTLTVENTSPDAT